MSEYLIIYGNDNSFTIIEAESFRSAVFGFAEYTGTVIEPIFKKALNAMNTPEELVKLYNRVTDYNEEIQKVYKIERQVFPEPVTNGKDGKI